MMQKNTISFIFLFTLLFSCKPKDNSLLMDRMRQWDMALETNPEAIRDSLQTLNPALLKNENKAYYGLLKTISDDKTFANFTSDSLIKETEYYYRTQNISRNLHIRALIYVSIVRSRMGITDSTTLIPLKQAETIFSGQSNQNPSIGYLLNFFLGSTHSTNNNLTVSLEYLKKSLQFAKMEKNASHVFDSYLAIFWNYMKQEEFIKAKEYLDSLQRMELKDADEKYFLLNAQSSYYYTKQKYEESIEIEKEQIKLAPFIKEKPEIFRIYYSISTLYQHLHQLDSAEVYSLKAIENITDSSYQLNYLLYENVADIAESKNDYQKANHYRKRAAFIRNETIEKTTDRHILELEKQYDLSQAENKTLQAEAKIRIAVIIILCLAIAIAVTMFYIGTRKIKAQQKMIRLEEEKRKTETDKKLAEARANILHLEVEKQHLTMNVYNMMLHQFFLLEKQLISLADKTRKTKPDFSDFIDEVRTSMNKNLIDGFAKNMSETKFHELTGITLSSKINKSELLMLFLTYCGVSNKNLAVVFRTTPESIRSRKNQLKNKLLSLNISTSFFDLSTSFFDQKKERNTVTQK